MHPYTATNHEHPSARHWSTAWRHWFVQLWNSVAPMHVRTNSPRAHQESDPTANESSSGEHHAIGHGGPTLDDSDFQEEPSDSEVVLQQVMRIRDASGRESIYATLRADFLPGQRYASLQVAFCPAFDVLPQIEAELIEGPRAEVKLQQAMHHGAHLEVRLEEPSDLATHCTIELAAYPPVAAPEPPTNE